MKLRKYFFILFFTLIYADDDFFEPGYSIGGYGELHWNKAKDQDGNSTKNNMDFHRFIIYYGYNWTENWSFKSEVELEHNYVSDGEGELEYILINPAIEFGPYNVDWGPLKISICFQNGTTLIDQIEINISKLRYVVIN